MNLVDIIMGLSAILVSAGILKLSVFESKSEKEERMFEISNMPGFKLLTEEEIYHVSGFSLDKASRYLTRRLQIHDKYAPESEFWESRQEKYSKKSLFSLH